MTNRVHRGLKKASRIWRREDGVSVIEFALIFPVLLAGFIGTVGVFDAMRASRLMTQAATTVVDLVTRQTEMDDETFDQLIMTAEAIVGTYAINSDFEVVMTSVINPLDPEDADDLEVSWSESTNDDLALETEDLAALNLPSLAEGDTLVMVSVSAGYTPTYATGYIQPIDMRYTAIRRPRFVQQLTYE